MGEGYRELDVRRSLEQLSLGPVEGIPSQHSYKYTLTSLQNLRPGLEDSPTKLVFPLHTWTGNSLSPPPQERSGMAPRLAGL